MLRSARYLYLAAAWLFVAGVIAEVFLIGMVVVAGRLGLDPHRGLGHALLLPLLLMLVTVHLGRLPAATARLSWLLFGVYALQAYVLIGLRAVLPALSALHPVLALADIVLGLLLAREALGAVRALLPLPADRRAPRNPRSYVP